MVGCWGLPTRHLSSLLRAEETPQPAAATALPLTDTGCGMRRQRGIPKSNNKTTDGSEMHAPPWGPSGLSPAGHTRPGPSALLASSELRRVEPQNRQITSAIQIIKCAAPPPFSRCCVGTRGSGRAALWRLHGCSRTPEIYQAPGFVYIGVSAAGFRAQIPGAQAGVIENQALFPPELHKAPVLEAAGKVGGQGLPKFVRTEIRTVPSEALRRQRPAKSTG